MNRLLLPVGGSWSFVALLIVLVRCCWVLVRATRPPRSGVSFRIGRTATRAPSNEIGDLAGARARAPRGQRPPGTQIGPTVAERKTTGYPPRRRGVKTGPGQRLSVPAACLTEPVIARGRARSPH